MEAGIRSEKTIRVDESLSALTMGSGTLRVYATPALLALVEEVAWTSVQPELEEGSCTVGTEVHLRHLAATPIGFEVTAVTTLTGVDGRKLEFEFEVRDEGGVIASGTHQRFVVNAERFQKKTDEKKREL